MAWQALAAVGANILGNALGSYASRKERRKAREMQRMQADALNKATNLGKQNYEYAQSVGTPEDAMFYGGLAGAKYKTVLDKNKDAFERRLGRMGVSPTSNAFLARFGGGAGQDLGEAGAYNSNLLARIAEGMSARDSAQGSVLRPVGLAKELQNQYGAQADAKSAGVKNLFRIGTSALGSSLSSSGNKDMGSLFSNISEMF